MNDIKCFECGNPQADKLQLINGRCDKCHKFNEEVKADKEYWRRRKEEIREQAHIAYYGKF